MSRPAIAPDEAEVLVMAMIDNLELLRARLVTECPEAEGAIDSVVNRARRGLLAVWKERS